MQYDSAGLSVRRTSRGRELPWLGAIFRLRPDGYQEFLGFAGALIHPKWLMTAAHRRQKNPGSLRVVFGRVGLRESRGDVHEVDLIESHDFDGHTSLNDITLYRLARPSTRTPVEYHRIPPALELPDTVVQAYGWGGRGKMLKTASLCILGTDDSVAQGLYPRTHSPYMFATTTRSDTPLCNGDSGGPVIATTEERSRYAIGIISFGIERRWESANRTTVHTRVSAYEGWINKTISEN